MGYSNDTILLSRYTHRIEGKGREAASSVAKAVSSQQRWTSLRDQM
jgi:hypothetical protein